MTTEHGIEPADDGFYYPSTEAEIIQLVKRAHDENLQLRVRGAAHSIAWAIYTDPGEGEPPVPNKVSIQDPPAGPNINIMLDRYFGLEWVDEAAGVVEVEAGIHLGGDPYDPSPSGRRENSLLYQAFEKGWAFNDLGGITHQTVSGFLSTGSAGGSLMHDLEENIEAFRVVDGLGQVRWIERSSDEDLFHAVGISFGLLGVITKVRLRLTPLYHIYGQEITTPTALDECSIDLFGPGRDGKPSLQRFLEETPYTRLLWWPQKKVERIATWQAARGAALPVFDPIPYKPFGDERILVQLQQLAGAILFTLLGNRGVWKVWRKLRKGFKQFRSNLQRPLQRRRGKVIGWLLPALLTLIMKIVAFFLVLLFGVWRKGLLWLYPKLIDTLQPLTKPGKADTFVDYAWRSLPMDNAADDVLLGTEFTEIFVPISSTERFMQLLDELFAARGFAATGYYATELYAGYKSDYWLSPSYKEHTFRVDVFWYITNEGNPAASDGFFRQFWELCRDNGLPFRLHWGKFLPEYDFKEWAAYFRDRYPRWDDFLALRAQRDPKNIFLTDYWRRHLLGE